LNEAIKNSNRGIDMVTGIYDELGPGLFGNVYEVGSRAADARWPEASSGRKPVPIIVDDLRALTRASGCDLLVGG